MPWRNAYWLAPAVLLLAASNPAGAQEAMEEDLEVELFFVPAETVTTASRHIQPLSQSPSAVTVLTREDIQTSGARSLPEALRLVPNMDIHMWNPLWYVVGVRGGTDLIADRMQLVVDGREVTVDFFGFPLWTAQHFSMDDVERIEVIRGPGSALYGSNAYSGVVHVVTTKPGGGSRAAVSIRGGENGYAELSCRGSGSLGPVSLSLSAGLEQSDFWTARDAQAKDVIRTRAQGGVELGRDTRVLAEAGFLRSEGSFYSETGTIDLHSMLNPFTLLRFEHQDLWLQAIYDFTDLDLDLGLALYYPDLGMDLARIPRIHGQAGKTGVQAQHSVEVFYNRLTYGAEYFYAFFNANILIPPDHHEHRFGVFFQDEIDVSGLIEWFTQAKIPPLFLIGGLRFDHNSVTDWELSPRASLVLVPDDIHSFRLGYAHAFLKPSFMQSSLEFELDDINDLGFKSLQLANTDLRNQTIDSLEFGYSGKFLDDHLVVRCDLAYNWYRDSIWWVYEPDEMEYMDIAGFRVPRINGPGYGFENDPDGEDGHNVELQVIVRPTDRSRIFVQAGYRQLFSNLTGSILSREPTLNLAGGADLSSEQGWTLSLRGFYTGPHERDLTNPQSFFLPKQTRRVPQALLLNARAAWTLEKAPFEMTIGLEAYNLLGARIREHAGIALPNGHDYGGERLGRRILFFMNAKI